MSDVIYLSNVRLSFPHLIEPQSRVNQDTGKERLSWNCEFIMPQNHPGFTHFMKNYGEIAVEKWKENAGTIMNMIQADRKTRCYGPGEEKVSKKTFKVYDGYQGMVFITAGRDAPPQIIQADGTPIDPANTMAYQQMTRRLYGGCRVNAAVKPWLQQPNTKTGQSYGVRCDLIAVQFAADDVAFGEGAVDASEMFGSVAAAPVAQGAPAPQMPGAPFPAPSLPPFLSGGQ